MASSSNKNSRGSNSTLPVEATRSLKRVAHNDDEDSDHEVSKKPKEQIGKLTASCNKGLTIQLKPSTTKKIEQKPVVTKKASVFGESSDSDEPEEMPPEARMRMKNIGRDTQTSSGPNSFGKTRQGFCDSKKVFERQLKKAVEESSD